MSAFTEKVRSFFSRFAEVSHEELAKVEEAVEEKVRPIVAEAFDEAKTDFSRLEERLKALEAKVTEFLGQQPAPAPVEPPAGS